MNGRKLPWGVVSEGGPSVQKEGFQGLLFGEEGLGEVLSRCRRGPAGVGRPPAPFLHSSSPFPSPHIKAPGRSEAPSRPCLPPRPLSTSMLSSPNPHGPATQPPARRLPSLSPCRGREPGAGAAAGEEVSAGLGVRGCGGAGGGRAPWFGTDGLTENRLPPPASLTLILFLAFGAKLAAQHSWQLRGEFWSGLRAAIFRPQIFATLEFLFLFKLRRTAT